MRIVAVADTHLFHADLTVPDGDLFVHAGDLCRGGSLDELAEAVAFIRALPHPCKLIVAGNHDWAFVRTPSEARARIAEIPGAVYLEDDGAVIDGVRFWGSPWQPEYNDWAFNLPRGTALAGKWARIPEDIDVLVTHCPPQGIGDRSSMGGRYGCANLRARSLALRPRLHLFGHIHDDGGAFPEAGIMFVNVTTWECERPPTVIDLDPATGAVSLVSVPPARTSRR